MAPPIPHARPRRQIRARDARGHGRPLLAITLVVGLAHGAVGCDNRVSQCNRLIDPVTRHTGALAASIGKLGEIQNDPSVTDGVIAAIEAAKNDIAALEFDDPKVAEFAKQYLVLLATADSVTRAMAAAAKANDGDALGRASTEADALVALEASIVDGVNAYCQG